MSATLRNVLCLSLYRLKILNLLVKWRLNVVILILLEEAGGVSCDFQYTRWARIAQLV